MVSSKVQLTLPKESDKEAVNKSIELADRYLAEDRWASHQSVLKAVGAILKVLINKPG